jgi:hypothetical protein
LKPTLSVYANWLNCRRKSMKIVGFWWLFEVKPCVFGDGFSRKVNRRCRFEPKPPKTIPGPLRNQNRFRHWYGM